MDPMDEQALSDLTAGQAAVYLSDEQTFYNIAGCKVHIYTEEQDKFWEAGDQGYMVLGLDVLVRHYLKTHKSEDSNA